MPTTNAHLAVLCNILFEDPVCSAAITKHTHTHTHLVKGNIEILHTALFPLILIILILLLLLLLLLTITITIIILMILIIITY